MSSSPSLQERFSPTGRCFGCGPTNDQGLRIRSFESDEGDGLVLTYQPRPEHEAWEGTVNGGILGALFDCHMNWTAAWHLRAREGSEDLPSTVTAEFHVKLRRPTPSTRPLEIRSRAVEDDGPRVTVEAVMTSGGKETGTCRGVFMAVPPGHPADHRWQ